jgi:polyketide cyclase/dehydrase/lipid transport protein
MLKKILIGLAALVVILLVVVALQPDNYRVSRTAEIAAPPPAVFAQVNDFEKWDAWSPWAKLDPNAKIAFEGPKAGKGAVFKWSGNDKIGEGSMTLTESRPAELVRIKVDFVKPFEGSSNTEFTLKPQGNRTAVTWTMFGEHNFIGKAMCLFMNGEKMMSTEIDKGLSQMKSVVEASLRQ